MYLLYKTNRFHFPVVRSVTDAQRTSQRGRNISDSLDFLSWATFLWLPRCDVICASITEQTTAKWNLFVKYIIKHYNRALNFFKKWTSYGKRWEFIAQRPLCTRFTWNFRWMFPLYMLLCSTPITNYSLHRFFTEVGIRDDFTWKSQGTAAFGMSRGHLITSAQGWR